jgi:hypothetical protein
MSESEASSTGTTSRPPFYQAEQAGAVSRIPADEIEALVVKCVRVHVNESTDIENAPLIHNHVVSHLDSERFR